MSRNYLAHEYFNRDWTPRYFAEVARELAEAKLTFAATAHFAELIDQLSFGDEVKQVLDGINNPLFRETVRDFFVNEQFRRDIFVKGALELTAFERSEMLRATGFALITPRREIVLQGSFASGQIAFNAEVYDPVLDALAEGPRSLGDLLAEPAVGRMGERLTLEVLTGLAALGQVAPIPEWAPDALRRESPERFNAAVLDRSRFGNELQALASPVTRGGVGVNRFDQLFLLARRAGEADLGAFAWARLGEQGEQIVKDGRVLDTPEANLAELRARADAFAVRRLPLYETLGIA
jgi:hypothetical protein